MFDSDQETSELDIQSRSWNKMKKEMKLIGFREGAAKGKELSLQEGFDLGYSDGFKLGEYFGIVKGVISCKKELEFPLNKKYDYKEETFCNIPNQGCVLCSEGKMPDETKQTSFKKFEDLISAQQNCTDEVIERLEKSDLKLYFEKK